MASASVWEKVWQEIRSGLVSSVGAEAILFPLDTVKLRQQVDGGSAASVLQRVLREHGLSGLYQGLIGRLIQTITSNVGFFIWQTLFVQLALERTPMQEKLGTVASLVLNMLAQQINRLLTTPFDVVASVNQADPKSKGFFRTFYRLARTGGVPVLWRGLPVALLLSLNPALMFTLVGKMSDFLKVLRKSSSPLSSSDMFWISGIAKTIATLLTYPLIRAKAVIQAKATSDLGLWSMMSGIIREEGWMGLYQGVWIMSYKTVLFNSLMMAMKQKVSLLLLRWEAAKMQDKVARSTTWDIRRLEGSLPFRQMVSACSSYEMPWEAAKRGASVVYVDGSWSFLHSAQTHFLQEAAQRGDHLIVGVHSDECHQAAVGSYPAECYAARLERLRRNGLASTILEQAPWKITGELLEELGVKRVLGGSVTKTEDCQPGPQAQPRGAEAAVVVPQDPYTECKQLGIFEEVPSLNASTEHDEWMRKVVKIAFSNVDASIDWRILVADGNRARFGANPGYAESLPPERSPLSPPLTPHPQTPARQKSA
eukprot:TRINITY_DN28874_c0_g1_i1.p1 TRINITY_DN28874_c0_g1~~TRINITY_DN28874_c0_g1_i1.p1  ORF type:complete len:539 (-),score=109.08 TRINITY_DN28874_c0_g1_i1:40-1656(-)